MFNTTLKDQLARLCPPTDADHAFNQRRTQAQERYQAGYDERLSAEPRSPDEVRLRRAVAPRRLQ